MHFSCCGAQPLGHVCFGRCVYKLSCPVVRRIFPDQGLNPYIDRQILNCWTTREVLTTIWKWKKVKVKSFSHVRLFATPWTPANQAPCPWDFPGKNTGVGCHFLLQEIFLTQGLNLGLLHGRQMLYHLSHHAYSKSFGLILWESFHLQNNHFNNIF